MTEHLKCPRYLDCPFYGKEFKICNETSGMVGYKVSPCFKAYDRWKLNQKIKKQ